MANTLINATKYMKLKKQMDALKAEMDALKAEMIEDMDGAEKVTCGQYTITNQTIKSRVIDTKRLKEERPDIAEEFTEEKETTRFIIR